MKNISKIIQNNVPYNLKDKKSRQFIGDLNALKTNSKVNLVESINEIKDGLNKVTPKREYLVEIIGEATSKLSGLMSASDKEKLDTIVKLFEEDKDTSLVDTINEVLKVFENYPQGMSVIQVLMDKISKNELNEILSNYYSKKESNNTFALKEEIPTIYAWAKASTKPTYTAGEVGLGNVTNEAQIPLTQKGSNNGVATLDENGKVPSSQLPSYVDDVVEYPNKTSFPTSGETGKIYVDTKNNLTYRWSGSQYVEISQSFALGETSSTAYAGDKGKANADAINDLKSRVDTIENTIGNIDTILDTLNGEVI